MIHIINTILIVIGIPLLAFALYVLVHQIKWKYVLIGLKECALDLMACCIAEVKTTYHKYFKTLLK